MNAYTTVCGEHPNKGKQFRIWKLISEDHRWEDALTGRTTTMLKDKFRSLFNAGKIQKLH